MLVYKLHNNVRTRLGKPITMTYPECALKYERFRAQTCTPTDSLVEGGCTNKFPLVCTINISRADGSDNDGVHVDRTCELEWCN